MGVTKHWHRLSREVLELPCLEISQSHLDTVLGNQPWVALHEQGLDQTDHQNFHQLPVMV